MAPPRRAAATAAPPPPPDPEVSPFVEHPRDDDDIDGDDDNAAARAATAPAAPATSSSSSSLRPLLVVLAALASGALLGLLLPADARHIPDPRYARASNALGWAAFAAWTVSFWPQIAANRRRRDARGLSVDFVSLNVLGFSCYALFCSLLYWNGSVADEFARRTGGASPVGAAVQLNDVAFALHAFLASSVVAWQCWRYDRLQPQGARSLAPATRAALLLAVGVVAAHALAARGASDAAAAVAERARRACEEASSSSSSSPSPSSFSAAPPPPWTLLDVAYTLSAVKMAVTLSKYAPQAAYNFRRRSTVGWSITNILLDASGGLCSLAQQLLGAWWWRDLRSVVSANPVRFALSVVSLAFDALFVVQHYVLFRSARRGVGGAKVVVVRRRGDEGEEDGGDAEERRRLVLRRGGDDDDDGQQQQNGEAAA